MLQVQVWEDILRFRTLFLIDFFTSEHNFSAKIEGTEKEPNEWKQKKAAASYHLRIWADGYREAANQKPCFAV